MLSGKRISQTWIGYAIMVVLFAVYSLLLTSSTSGEWFSYFLPAAAGIPAIFLFLLAIAFKVKIPQLPLVAWITIGVAGGYFLTRAWFSPDFYGSIQDMLPMVFALIFYVLGILIGFSRSSNRLLFVAALVFIAANTIMLNDIFLFNENLVVGRPSQSMLLYQLGNTGTFGYENFTAQFLVGSSFFCVAYFIFSGFKSWPWLILGILGCASALPLTDARSIYPNMILGGIICWGFLLIRCYSKTKIFVTLSIFSIIGTLIFSGYLLSLLTHQTGSVSDLSTSTNSSGRFLFLAMIPQIVESTPWIGHGAQSFPHTALPLMPMGMMPNMAHNEYAQSITDYGWTGFALMVSLLASHLVLGLRLILRKTISLEFKSIYAASFCLISIMCFHAAFDFIWHNGALTSSAGLALGILSTSATNQARSGSRFNNGALISIGILLILGLSSFCKISYPIWKLSWDMNNLPALTKNAIGAEHLEILDRAVTIAGDPEQTNKLAHIILNSPSLATRENCTKLIEQLVHSLRLSPQNDMLKTCLGRAYDNVGDYEKAEALLSPYSYPDYYRAYPWKDYYMTHLARWADSQLGKDNAIALSLILEMDRMYPLQNAFGIKSKKQTELLKELLLRKKIKPNDSWKKNRTPSDFPTSYGPSLPGLVPLHP